MTRFIIILVVVGIVLLIGGISEYRLSSSSKSEPQRITCAQLGNSGPGDNSFVTLTDFHASEGSFVYQAKEGSTDNWTNVWVPLLPSNDAKSTHFKVILDSSEYHHASDLAALDSLTEINGMVVNKISSLGSKQRDILAGSYPGVDLDSVYILQQNRHPHGAGFLIAMLGGGAALILLGIGMGVKRFASR